MFSFQRAFFVNTAIHGDKSQKKFYVNSIYQAGTLMHFNEYTFR